MRTPRRREYQRRAQNYKPGRYSLRCSKCDARSVRYKHPETYRREPKCGCGGELRVDWYRTTGAERRAYPGCVCGAYHFPHRAGSGQCGKQE